MTSVRLFTCSRKNLDLLHALSDSLIVADNEAKFLKVRVLFHLVDQLFNQLIGFSFMLVSVELVRVLQHEILKPFVRK